MIILYILLILFWMAGAFVAMWELLESTLKMTDKFRKSWILLIIWLVGSWLSVYIFRYKADKLSKHS